MGLTIGIVGMPNVGKSTLFNAMTRAGALVANYPFATIDPNTGVVEVPDPRLQRLADLFKPPSVVPATVTFVDIAGLVKGASEGEGLGNQFLAHIRECDAIAMVARAFEDPNVTHVGGRIDPGADIATVDYELMLADLETVRRRLERTAKLARQGQKGAAEELAVLEKVEAALDRAVPARRVGLNDEERGLLRELSLLTLKPVIYIANVGEDQAGEEGGPHLEAVAAIAAEEGSRWLPISARIESELRDLEPAEAAEFLASLGLRESGLDRLAREAYELLGLITFLTAGEDEVRAWTIRRGTRAPQAAAVIHGDFERGFIKAEVVGWEDLVAAGSWAGAKAVGKVRIEGREYVFQDGDTTIFRFNV
ncbi:MAG: ribosome-binding ATPase [Chloroflexota bacterium]|nr:ribosome-binding ATPase [Chloroflexota bacterium]